MKTATRFAAATLALAILPVLFQSSQAAAATTTWHVRTDGSDSNCTGVVNAADPGTGTVPRACAFAGPQKAVDSAISGDTVLIHAGTYTAAGTAVQGQTDILGISLRSEFLSDATRLTVKAAGDGEVIFDGGGLLHSGVTIYGASYVTIKGISLRNFTAGIGGTFVFGGAAVNVSSPGPLNPSNYLVLDSLTISDNTLDFPTGSHAEIAMWCTDCANNTIKNCSIDSVEPAAIAVGSPTQAAVDQRGVIEGNTILHVRDGQFWNAVLAENTSIWRVERNYIDETATPDLGTDFIVVTDAANWLIDENVMYRPPRRAIDLVNPAFGAPPTASHLVLNNTIECNPGVGSGLRLRQVTYCQVRNNIIASCRLGMEFSLFNSSSAVGYNDLSQNLRTFDNSDYGTGYVIDSGNIYDDPLFRAQPPRPDPYYRLQADSPAIDAGDNLWCAEDPPDGNCDMGAYQGTGGGGANVPPDRPSIISVDGITGRGAVLHGSAFSDANAGDHHINSQWQVDLATGNFSHPVFDSGATSAGLTSHTAKNLAPTTTYKARVRYEDSGLLWSPWSDPKIDTNAEFTTLVATAVPPRVVSVVPARGAKDVATLSNTDIQLYSLL